MEGAIKGQKMKRTISILVVISVFVGLMGCQATPKKPVVVQKDMEQMIEKTALCEMETDKPVASLKERLGIPDTLVFESTEGKRNDQNYFL